MSHTFLDIVTAFCEKCGVVAPSTAIGQSGEKLRMVNWVNDAWTDIQSTHEDWDFMRSSFSFVTTAAQATYTPTQAGITDFGMWKQDSCRVYTTTSNFKDEMLAAYMEYATWRNLYQYGNMRTTYSRPVVVTITPDKQLGLGPTPDTTGYTVVGEYLRVPSDLAADASVPSLPDKFWRIIVYRAMMFYGAYEAAPEVYDAGEKEYKRLLARMTIDQIVSLSFGGPLA